MMPKTRSYRCRILKMVLPCMSMIPTVTRSLKSIPTMKQRRRLLEKSSAIITKWDESVIRQLVESVKVVSKEQLLVTLKDGVQIQQSVIE